MGTPWPAWDCACFLSARLAYRSSRLPRVIGALLVVGLGVSTLTAYALPGLPALIQHALAPPPITDFWLVL